jgi:hypothetical protein
VKALELQKQFLIAESELNRAHLVEDVAALTTTVHSLTNRAKSLGSIVSSVTTLAFGLTGCRRRKPATSNTKVSWLHTVLKAAGLISSIWTAFSRPGDGGDGNRAGASDSSSKR